TGKAHAVIAVWCAAATLRITTCSEVGAALSRDDARELPAIYGSAHKVVGSMDRSTFVNRVGNVEELPAVCRQNAIIGSQIERVIGRGNNPQSLLVCVVRLNRIAACMAYPAHLQCVVVGIEVVGGHDQIAIALQRPEVVGISKTRIGHPGHSPEPNQVDVAAITIG